MTKRPEKITLRGTVTLAKEDDGSGPRPFKMLAYTGAVVSRFWGAAIFELSGMEVPTPLPILFNHNEDRIVGHATSATFTDEGLLLEGIVSDKTESGNLVRDLAGDGYPWTASIGVSGIKWEELHEPDQVATVNGIEVAGPISIARACGLHETSFMSAGPADKNTHASVLRDEENTNPKEGRTMNPKEFLAAHPAAVDDWKAQGKLNAVHSLAALSVMFPGRTDLVLKAFTEAEGDELKAQAGMAVLLHQHMTEQLSVQPAPVAAVAPAQQLAAPQGDPRVANLAQQANHPGLGFNGQGRQEATLAAPVADTLAHLSTEERLKAEWDDPTHGQRLRAEFGNRFGAFKAVRSRELAGV